MLVETVLLLVLLLLFWYWATSPPPGYPPMPPIRLPIVGHALYLRGYKNMQEAVMDLMIKYGKDGFLALHFGPLKNVFVADLAIIKEAFKREELNYRFQREEVHKIAAKMRGGYGKHGIINSYEKTWTEQRRFTLRTLREFGFGKSGMEEMVNNEVAEFIPFLLEEAAANNGAIVVSNLFNVSILNALWQIISGERYDYKHPELRKLTAMVNEIITSGGPRFSLASAFPFLRKIWPGVDRVEKSVQKNVPIREFITKAVEEHKASYNPDAPPRDFIDMYLGEIEKADDPTSSFYGYEGTINLINTLIDLFFAGSETTSSTLTWGVLYLILRPEVQDKMREEIMKAFGQDRQPSLSDRAKLPFTEAVIQEIQRLGNIAPFALPHSTFRVGIELGKYRIPKRHTIFAQLGGVMKSPWEWGPSAEDFLPERFYNEADGSLIKDERLVPFSVGKRQCPGETLARAEIFLYLTGLLQKLRFSIVDPGSPPSPENYVSGTTASPTPFEVRVERI